MKISYKFTILLILSFSFFSKVLISQEYQSTDKEGKRLIKIAREIVDSSRYCALITLNEKGSPQARPMDPFKPDNHFIIRFGTNSNSRKVSQIKNDPRVTLYYLSNDATSYLTVTGTARLVYNKEAKEKWWKDQWKGFYTDKEEGYLIIEVTPLHLELISETKGIFGDNRTWKAPVIIFDHN